jgi:hypothetical protein
MRARRDFGRWREAAPPKTFRHCRRRPARSSIARLATASLRSDPSTGRRASQDKPSPAPRDDRLRAITLLAMSRRSGSDAAPSEMGVGWAMQTDLMRHQSRRSKTIRLLSKVPRPRWRSSLRVELSGRGWTQETAAKGASHPFGWLDESRIVADAAVSRGKVATNFMIRHHLLRRRINVTTYLLGFLAPCPEPAPRRSAGRTRDIAGEYDPLPSPLAHRIGDWRRRQ